MHGLRALFNTHYRHGLRALQYVCLPVPSHIISSVSGGILDRSVIADPQRWSSH